MKLSIVIPTYNAHEWIEQCLDSIRLHRPTCDYEVIVVDDQSTDDSVAIVRQKFPDTRLFSNPRNLGFGRTVNVGLRAAAGAYILVLNNDTWMHEGALDAMTRYLDDHRDTGIVGPKVLSGNGAIQQQCRRRIPTPAAALLYFTGVARMFPKSPRIAGYLTDGGRRERDDRGRRRLRRLSDGEAGGPGPDPGLRRRVLPVRRRHGLLLADEAGGLEGRVLPGGDAHAFRRTGRDRQETALRYDRMAPCDVDLLPEAPRAESIVSGARPGLLGDRDERRAGGRRQLAAALDDAGQRQAAIEGAQR